MQVYKIEKGVKKALNIMPLIHSGEQSRNEEIFLGSTKHSLKATVYNLIVFWRGEIGGPNIQRDNLGTWEMISFLIQGKLILKVKEILIYW